MSLECFFNCRKLSIVEVGTNLNYVCTISNNVFVNTPMTNSSYLGYYGSIYVPDSLVSAYQTAKTSTFTLSSNNYYKVSIYVNSQNLINNNLSITLSTDNETIGQVKNINTENTWKEVVFFVKTFENDKTCTLTVKFGDEVVNNKGYVFIDNAKLETIEETAYTNATQTNLTYKADLSKVDFKTDNISG